MHILKVSGISRQEEGRFQLKEINFTQRPFQKLAIAGATGSGKTTLLKIIAGLLQPGSGAVWFEDERIEGPEEKLMAGHPHIAYLSQHFELLNKYRVADFLDMKNQLPDSDAALIYAVCKIDHLLKRWTHQLSGGERQRIALARLLVSAPRLLLLDEPYSNLDAIHKATLKRVIDAVGEQLQITCILVAHDPVDLLSWADEILVLENGRLIQKGTPEHMYRYPLNDYAAALFGKYTILKPELVQAFTAMWNEPKKLPHYMRPEQFVIVDDEHKGLKGLATNVRFMGTRYEVDIMLSGTEIIVDSSSAVKKGDTVYVALV